MQIMANPLSSSSKPTLFLVSVSMHSPLLHYSQNYLLKFIVSRSEENCKRLFVFILFFVYKFNIVFIIYHYCFPISYLTVK